MVRPPVTPIKLSHTYGHDPLHYPIKAITYAVARPTLWKIVFSVACTGLMLAVFTLVLLFGVALKPQAAWLSADLPWWAWLVAVLLVLLEAAIVLGTLLFATQSRAQKKLFEATMQMEGAWKSDMTAQSTAKDMNLVKKAMIVRYVTFPIQLIPVAGGAVYAAINATFTGWDMMDRYFDAIGLSSRRQRQEVFGEDNTDYAALFHRSTYDPDNDYARFGFMVGFLESVPIVGFVLFPLTNAVAAALFASDIEKAGGPACLKLKDGDEKPEAKS